MKSPLSSQLQCDPPGRAAGKISMETETDESLITYMGFHEDERETAETAAGELYRRYSRKMTAWCAKSFLLYRQDHEDLVKRTFKKALTGAKAFSPQLAAQTDADAKTRHIKLWLYRILRNACLDARRSERLEREQRSGVDVETVEMITLDPPEADSGEAPTIRRVELVHQFAVGLNDQDQAILYNTMQFYDRGTGQVIMSKPVLDALCAELGMTRISLRTKRCRLLQDLRQFILENE
jgi:DNA-directed RNA polymerase specialized sigma24 family protein